MSGMRAVKIAVFAAAGLARSVGDYLAGMTDRYAWREFERLFVA